MAQNSFSYEELSGSPGSDAKKQDSFSYEDLAGPTKPRTRGLFEAVNDNVIEFANAAAGGVSALANFVKPGNAVSGFIDENIIKAGEAKQSDVVRAEKQRLSQGLQDAQGIGEEVGTVGRYVLDNPLLAASQAAGSFALPGGAVKGAGAAAKALGAGVKGVETAGRVGGIAAGAAMSGGDAAGTAYDLSSQAGATEDQAIAAGRQASVIPALVGGVTGAFGAEKLLAGAKGFGGNALFRGLKSGLSEAGQEALDEGVTQYEGQRAAMPYDSTIDPTKGVAGAAAMGGIMGFGPGAVLGAMGGGPELPSKQMGIDPSAGPLSRAAASAVDSAPPPQLGFSPLAGTPIIYPDGSVTLNGEQDFQKRNPGAQPADKRPISDRQPADKAATPPATPLAAPVPMEGRSLDELRQAFRSAQEPAIRKSIAAEIRKRREATPVQPSLIDQPGEKALEPQAPEAVQSQPQEAPPAALGKPLTETGAGMLGRGADPLQSIIQGQADARRAADELRTSDVPSTGAGSDIAGAGVESELGAVRGRGTDAAVDQPAAKGDAGSGAGGAAGSADALRPERWRTNAIQAGKVARGLGLDPKGKRLKEIVAEIDAVDAGSGVVAKSAASGYEAAKSVRDAADARVKKASEAMQKYPRGAMGLTPDDVKSSPQWKADKAEMDAAMRDLQKANSVIAKDFSKEYRAERDAKRAAQANVQNPPQAANNGQVQAPSVEASTADRGNEAAAGGVPAAGDTSAMENDGVKSREVMPAGLTLEVGGKFYPVDSLAQASEMVSKAKNRFTEAKANGKAGGFVEDAPIRDVAGRVVGYVGRGGSVFDTPNAGPRAKKLYDAGAELAQPIGKAEEASRPALPKPAAPGAGDVQADGVKPAGIAETAKQRRAAALDRIAKGTAYFGSKAKADDFLAKSGIGDTHKVVQSKPGRFEIRANEATAPSAVSQPNQEKELKASAAPASQKAPAEPPKRKALLLRAVGQKMAEQGASDQARDRNTNTARRASMAASADADARKREAMGKTLMNLADAIESGAATKLAGITTKAQVEALEKALMRGMIESERDLSYVEKQRQKGRAPTDEDVRNARFPKLSWSNGGADSARLLEAIKGKKGSKDVADMLRFGPPRAEQLAALKKLGVSESVLQSGFGWWNIEMMAEVGRLERAGIKTDEDLRGAIAEYIEYRDGPKKEDPIKAAERKLIGQKVGLDFFPTPKVVADRMAQAADIKPGMRVLEPSAGNGNLADAAKSFGAEVDVVEVSDALREVLSAKGYELVGRDFLSFEPTEKYDAIMMNPPFSNRLDAEHIQRAFGMLKPGGRLVAIAGEGVFNGVDKKAQAFRAWLEEVGASVEKLPAATFKDTQLLATTGANARLIEIEAPQKAKAETTAEPSKPAEPKKDKPQGDAKLSVDDNTSQPDTEDYGPATQAHRDAAARFSESFGNRLGGSGPNTDLLDAVAPRDGTARGRSAASVAAVAKHLFNREVVYVKFKGKPKFNGAVSKSAPGFLFLNIDSQKPLMAVLGHELLHEMSRSQPSMYANLSRRLDDLIRNETAYGTRLVAQYKAQGISTKGLDAREELEADIVGDNFMDAEFWREMGKEQPALFQRIVGFITRWLDGLSQRLSGARVFGTDEFLTDIAAARSAVSSAMREFSGAESVAVTTSDPNDQDIVQFSIADAVEQVGKQAAVKPVVQALNDTFKVRGKLHWWHKTVGTPFNLAEKVPEFKRVFNAVQDFINSVSFYGAEAAAMAPKIIPKLESWKDLGKSPIKAEDNKAIAAPIFEGTLSWMRDESGKPVKVADMQAAADKLSADEKAQRLLRARKINPQVLTMWRGLPVEQFQANINARYTSEMLAPGVVWKNAELRSMFKLTDEQIGLYKEFRSATDKSLTDLAMSDILQLAGKDADPIKDQVMGMSLEEGSETVRDYLMSLADSDPDRRESLMDTANAAIDKANKVQTLMDRGYAPLQRFGRYTVYAKDAEGEQLFFGMYEDRWAAARAARQMREQYPEASVETGMMSQEAYKLFQGISPETLEIFGTMLGMDSQEDGPTNEAFQKYLKLAKSNRSALKRLIERKGIAGYSEDASRVLAAFIYSNARQTASNLHVGEIMNGVNDIPRDMGDAKDAAMRLARYTMDPQEEAQAIRGLLFAQYLGGSIASAAINALQPAQVTFPYLSQFVGAKKSAVLMKDAVRDALKKKTGDARLDSELKKAEEEGIVSPQEIFQLMAQAQGKATLRAGDGTTAGDAAALASNTLSRVSLGWGKVFSIPEQFNRRTTFIAAYRTALETGEANPYEFAKQAVKETQLVYNKGNRPEWARGAIGALAFTFKTYSISYVELLQRMAESGPEGRRAALLMVGVLFLMAGAGGLPGIEDAEDVVDGIAQRVFGLNFQARQKRQEWLADLFGEGGARFIENGLSGLPWSPTDVSGRLGLGNLIPGTGLFIKKESYGRDVAEIAGPAADMTKRFLEGAGLLLQGEVLKAGEIASPVAVRNIIQGGRMLATDQYTDTKGRKVIDTTTAEGITKLIGFQPADVARVQEATGTTQRMIVLNKIRESEIADKWAKGLASGDADLVQEARDDLARWNRANPESQIKIKMPQVLRRVRALKEDKATRIARTAPAEIRQDVRRALEQGQ